MLLLLSPAKKLDFEKPVSHPRATRPRLGSKTQELVEVLRAKSADEIAGLMSLSESLAATNRERFKAFGEQTKRPAILAFAGDVYRGLDARTMGEDDLAAAQDRLRILSGLYGLLRPLDLIEPYRLEMGTKLKTADSGDLYGFWDDEIAKLVTKDLKGHDDRMVVNLASTEYFRSVSGLDVPVVTPIFRERKDGQERTLALFAKVARGMMARYAVDERLDRVEGLKDFRGGGYRFQKSRSDDSRWVFTRSQPAKKS